MRQFLGYSAIQMQENTGVSSYNSLQTSLQKRLTREEGIPCSHSSGAAVVAALEIARTLEEGVVVTLLPDSFERYP